MTTARLKTEKEPSSARTVKKVAYFPGCALKTVDRAYDHSARIVARYLEIELVLLKNPNCSGGGEMKAMGDVGLFFPIRNLMLAEQTGQTDLVMPCNVCYHELSRANTIYRTEADRREAVNDLFTKAGEPLYQGRIKERHLLEYIYNEVGVERIRSLVKRPLSGLKVAPYYGCLYTRPSIFTGTDRRDPKLDDAERPYFMHRILEALGCTVSEYQNETACCGGRNVMQDPETSMLLCAETLGQAKEAMGEVMSVICPKCAGAMDINQPKIVERYGQKADLPVVFFTQLMGLAFGESRRRMKFSEMTTQADDAIQKAGFD